MSQEPEIPREIVIICVVARVVAIVSAIMQLVGVSRIALNSVATFDLLTLPGALINTLLGPVAVYLLTLILLTLVRLAARRLPEGTEIARSLGGTEG